MAKIVNKWFPDLNFFHNYPFIYNGRIWLLCKSSIEVSVIDIIDQCHTVKIQFALGCSFFSVVYGLNIGSERRSLWSHLISLHDQIIDNSWMLAGDFNIIADSSESLPVAEDKTASCLTVLAGALACIGIISIHLTGAARPSARTPFS